MTLLNVPKKEMTLDSIVIAAAKKLVLDRMRLTKPIKLAIESVVEITSVGGKWVMVWFYYFGTHNSIHPTYYNYAFSVNEWVDSYDEFMPSIDYSKVGV